MFRAIHLRNTAHIRYRKQPMGGGRYEHHVEKATDGMQRWVPGGKTTDEGVSVC